MKCAGYGPPASLSTQCIYDNVGGAVDQEGALGGATAVSGQFRWNTSHASDAIVVEQR